MVENREEDFSVTMEKKLDNADTLEVEPGSIDAIESQDFDAPATNRLLRKLDWHIIPFMSLIYL